MDLAKKTGWRVIEYQEPGKVYPYYEIINPKGQVYSDARVSKRLIQHSYINGGDGRGDIVQRLIILDQISPRDGRTTRIYLKDDSLPHVKRKMREAIIRELELVTNPKSVKWIDGHTN